MESEVEKKKDQKDLEYLLKPFIINISRNYNYRNRTPGLV